MSGYWFEGNNDPSEHAQRKRTHRPRVEVEILSIRPPSWTQYAKCGSAGSDLDDLFFPATGTQHRSELAQRFCNGCPVRNLCAGLGEETNSSSSFWGGEWRK